MTNQNSEKKETQNNGRLRAIFGQSEFRIKETQNNGKFLSYQLCRLINSAWILELIFIFYKQQHQGALRVATKWKKVLFNYL